MWRRGSTKDLELNLSQSEAARIKPDAPVNPLAYDYYLRGVDLLGQHNFTWRSRCWRNLPRSIPATPPASAYLGASYNSDAAFELGGHE